MDKQQQRCLNISSTSPVTERANGIDEAFHRSSSIRRCISAISSRFKKAPFDEFTPVVVAHTANNCKIF